MNKSNFSNICGFDFLLYTTTMGFFLARDLTDSEQALLGNFFLLLGQNILSIQSYCAYTDEICKDKKIAPNHIDW